MAQLPDSKAVPAAKDRDGDALAVKYLPFLTEIQRSLYILLSVIFIAAILGFAFYQRILSFVLHFFNLSGITIALTNPYQFLDLAVNTGLATGVVVAFPLLIYFILHFTRPALKAREFRLLKVLIPVSLILFLAGFVFGAWIMQFVVAIYRQTALDFNITNIWDISHFFAQIIILGLSMGLVFQLPIVITILLRLKIIKKQALSSRRRVFYAGIILFAMILPPNDIVSLSILTIVPLFLFEIALLLN